ncbi:MAG: sulfonate ABC transporter substrate-binding protein [Pedobacter sp.]|nr:sulfonate ABC transporter substrate-binding protein [Pedobacter sp.]
MKTRFLLLTALLSSLAAGLLHAEELTIGFQKASLNLILLKSKGTLEKRLGPQGITVKWIDFPAGPQLLEALNVGSVDFAMTGDTPPIFAQAAGTSLVYIGNEPPKPKVSAILVAKDSPLKSLTDLKGKKVAFQKGSSANYLVIQALESSGLSLNDIQPVYLAPAEARAVFETGSVDAWAVWEPFYSATEKALAARALTNGVGLSSNPTFYLASKKFSESQPKVIAVIFDELSKNDDFLQKDRKGAAKILGDYVGISPVIFENVLERLPSVKVNYLDAETIASQQRIADTFFRLGIIPKAVKVSDIVWHPETKKISAK